MAKQVSEILVRLGIQGAEGLDKLSSAFRSLEKSIGPTDKVIQEARQSIIDFAGSGKQSIQTIQGQIDAFKGLQTQATIGGNVYRQLAGDVNRLSDTLKALKTDYEEVGRAAKRTDAQIAEEFAARKPEAFRKQLAALNRQLDQLSVSAQGYGDQLTKITIKEIAFGRAQARQQVIAGARAVGAPLIAEQQPRQQLPNTLAALQLRISELTQDFQNLDRAGAPYQDTLAEINRLQRELTNATEDGNADRKEEIRARIENYRQITAENTSLREQAAIRRSIERGRARAAAGVPVIVEEPARRTSSLFEGIANIAAVSTRRETELLGKSYSDVAITIQKVSAASDGSIASLQAQRGVWQALRNQVDPTTAVFKQASREIEQLDRRLGKLQQTQSRRMTGMQMAQAAGAALSGGIFGGPEGFLGGALGTAVGGVGGAFAGAAIGAQVGGLRQQLGGFADYAAQIQKMEIALRNAAGSQDQFSQAMAAAASATQNLNVPQDIAIQGMTKLTAAVKGAGGQVSDAELVFKNVTSAIKATGGSAQDVDGAITAMVQVFSKGKVSAEELSGQLGERLPGAVTKFAKANNMTLPELQKALEQGQVGLNELMNFIVALGGEYAGVAEKIAASSQDAGARLTVAFNEMKIAIGETLQPVGAQFQEAFAEFIRDITPAAVAASKAIGDGIKFIIDNASQIGAVVEFAAKLAGVTLALKALQAMQGPIGTLFLALQGGFAATTAQAAAAQTRIIAFGTAVKTVAASLVAPIVITVAISGAQVVINWLNKIKEAQDRVKKAATATRGESWIQEIGGSATDYATLKNQVQAAGDTYQYLADKIKTARQEMATTPFKPRREFLAQQIAADEAQMVVAQSRYRAGIDALGRLQSSRPAVTEFPDLAGGARKGKADKAADKAAREAQQRFDEELQNLLQVEDFTLKKFALEEKIRLEQEKQGAIQAGTLESEMQLKDITNQKLDLDIRANAVDSQREKLDKLREEGLARGLDIQKVDKQIQENKLEDLRIQLGYQENSTQEIKAQVDLEKERQSLNRALNQELEDRRYELGLITKEEYNRLRIERERRRLEEAYRGLPDAGPRIQEGVDLFRRQIDPTFAEGLQSQIAIVKRELDELTNPINQVVGAANAIGDAFSQSFASVINGSATTQEALASFFQNLANYFLDMAAQIIQKMIVMAILNQVVGLLPGGNTPTSPTINPESSEVTSPIIGPESGEDFNLPGQISTGILTAANGAAFSRDGIQPFAMGGIVNKPTLFKYADGGTGRFGLMGEAGPEAIIPLKRGRDGRLGVSGGGSTNVTVNVDAQGTRAQGDDNRGQQLGQAVAAAVQAELIKQKRPGGLLA